MVQQAAKVSIIQPYLGAIFTVLAFALSAGVAWGTLNAHTRDIEKLQTTVSMFDEKLGDIRVAQGIAKESRADLKSDIQTVTDILRGKIK